MTNDNGQQGPNLFPEVGLIPKQETNVLEFLKKNPTYDGRNVRIGILDSGVDPGSSEALRTMLDGTTPKLVEVVDCSGAGDVDMTKETEATWVEEEGGGGYWSVTGLSGRELKLSAEWKFQPFPVTAEAKKGEERGAEEDAENEEEEEKKGKTVPVRLGFKRGYDIYASALTRRVKAERQRLLDVEIAKYEADVRKELADWNATHANAQRMDAETIRQRDELNARLEILQSKDWQEDPGPVYDCVEWYDGEDYRAVVGEDADMRKRPPMTSYGKEKEYMPLGVIDQLNFAVQFYENGKVLSLVVDSSPHGTHVAGIAAAAEGPDRNGVAPGAELVSLKIGEARMAGMETGGALTRALIEAIRLKCDVINMSYGEADTTPNAGRFVKLAEELVWKHNIEFVSSAGNNGPCLTSTGAPGSTSTACFGIAAYVSPEMMQVLYSMPLDKAEDGKVVFQEKEEYPGSTFTWSSVGPVADGSNGVNAMAPGGAIAPISNWCLAKTRLMNGTSMSSPHACGLIALLISACKAAGIAVSPARLRRAIENTAKPMPGMISVQQGAGMIQVDKAWEYLKRHEDVPHEDIYYDVKVGNSLRGIYLRQAHETGVENSFVVTVDPQWQREAEVSQAQQESRLSFETQFTLETTAPDWVTCPSRFVVLAGGRSFKIVVDPTGLQAGLHTAKIIGRDASNPDRTLFNVPIVVAKPLEEKTIVDLQDLWFLPSEAKRFFLTPPLGSTWMDIVVKDTREVDDASSSAKLLALHTVQLLPHAAFRDFEKKQYIQLRPAQTTVVSVPVEAGITAEVCLARAWNTLGEKSISVNIKFRGARPVPDNVVLTNGLGAMVRATSDLADETILPKASLTSWRTPIRPKAGATPKPLGERDIFPSPDRMIHELVLQYEFTQDDKGSITPRVPALQDVLYESGFEGQLILVFDGDKKLLGTCDAWPSAVNVPKGKVVIRLQIRHDSPKKLEKLKDLTMWIERSLENSINLSAYGSKEALVTGGSTLKKQLLRKGKSTAIFFEAPSVSKLPSSSKPGDILKGSFTLGAGNDSFPGSGKRPGGFPLTYVVGPKPEKAPSDPDPPEPEDKRTVDEKIEEAIRDLKVAQLGKLTKKEKEGGKFEELYESLAQQYPGHLPLLMAKLKYLDAHEKRSEKIDEIVETAEALISSIPQDALAMHFGKKSDNDDPVAVKERKEMKEKKSMLTEALARLALAYSAAPDEETKFAEALKRLKEWTDIDSNDKGSDKFAQLVMAREEKAGRLGAVMKVINKILAKDIKEKDYLLPISKSALYEKRVEILTKLGYISLADHDKCTRVISCPPTYSGF